MSFSPQCLDENVVFIKVFPSSGGRKHVVAISVL
jgi:hypothetical protein